MRHSGRFRLRESPFRLPLKAANTHAVGVRIAIHRVILHYENRR